MAEATFSLAIRSPTEYRSPRPQRRFRFDLVPPGTLHPESFDDPILPYFSFYSLMYVCFTPVCGQEQRTCAMEGAEGFDARFLQFS